MNRNDKYIAINQKYWNELAVIHEKSEFYGVEEFKKGKSTLSSLEVNEIGYVARKSLLHLQCHFGLDTLSWSRLGAEVTGVDLSDGSIAFAKRLSEDLDIKANFIVSDIYKLPEVLDEQFDIVYTTGGVLCWLSNLKKWTQLIRRYLKLGGLFYIREEHPFANMFNHDFILKTSDYFETGEPEKVIPKGSYANRQTVINTPSYQWHHSLGEILNSLLDVGLQIQFFHEFPFMGYARFPKFMEKSSDGWYRFKDKEIQLPLMFSLRANKL